MVWYEDDATRRSLGHAWAGDLRQGPAWDLEIETFICFFYHGSAL
jgi:hypothetical protein